MFLSSRRFFTALCSSLQRLLLGVLAVLRMELTLCLSSCAVSLSSWPAVASVAAMISKVGIRFGVTAKFRPSASASFSFGARLLLLRFFTILSWSSCGGARCCLTCRHSYFCGAGQSLLVACTEPTLTPLILLHLPRYSIPVTITALIIITSFPAIFTLLTASDTPSYYLIESRLLSFVTAEEDLWIETSCPFNEATAVFMLKNLCYHHTSHSDEPLSYQESL